jgi:hypothetical protein
MTLPTHGAACLDFPHQQRSSRVKVPDAQANTGFGEWLAALRKAVGFEPKRHVAKQEGDCRLRRRLLAIEELDAAERRQVLQLLDAFIGRGQLKRNVESRA